MTQLMIEIALGELLILLLLRPLILWYFKLSRMTKALESIDLSLRQLPAVKQFDATAQKPRRWVA